MEAKELIVVYTEDHPVGIEAGAAGTIGTSIFTERTQADRWKSAMAALGEEHTVAVRK